MAAKTNPVVWFEIYVNNMARARKFYETVLNDKLEKMPMVNNDHSEMYMFPMSDDMSAPNVSGMLVKMEGIEAGGNSTIVYFGSDDCSVEESRVVAAGGKVIHSKFSIDEYGFICLCLDTEGNCFGVHSMQ
ncbi:VOC family protein [Dysgonomonas sp. Marseille-P4677]|uniref:VOC family protein n=1 Tax=Dysgonomonas sp. Marseille-P4677 TaxID=2364790 RepID=UPI00191180D5|nr:VOC family protein [Dysgonomonas sp. Marseille-P4677]MBK5721843.1 VOC family protein [Dysgonomonas sp. Marseille-P4677]